jgi:hypothetical protein
MILKNKEKIKHQSFIQTIINKIVIQIIIRMMTKIMMRMIMMSNVLDMNKIIEMKTSKDN